MKSLFKSLLSLAFLLSITTSCSTITLSPPRYKQFTGVDKELKPYLDKFYKEYGHKIGKNDKKRLTAGFGLLPKNAIGMCASGFINDKVEITIDRRAWSRMPLSVREALVLHEFAHCACDREHDYLFKGKLESYGDGVEPETGQFADGCSKSIMAPIIVSGYCYEKHKKAYHKEIMDTCKQK